MHGFIASFFLIAGVFYAESRYVYVAVAAGVLLNGLMYWLIGEAVRRRITLAKGLNAPKAPGPERQK